MKSENLIEYLKDVDKGICKVCGSPKGHFGFDDKYLCYKCDGYELLGSEEVKLLIKRNKKRLREEFKKIAVKSDIFYCLKVFLSLGEYYFIDEKNSISIRPTSSNKESILKIDPRSIALANMGVKWLLEDSLGHLQRIVNWNNTHCVNMLNILITWLGWNNKEKLSDIRYNLGLFVSKEGRISFFYTQQYDFYLDSLTKFNIVSRIEEINEKMVENILKLHRDFYQNPEKLKKYVRDEYPVLISTILNSYYTDEVNRPFSFDTLLDKEDKKMKKLLSQCNPGLQDILIRRKRRFPEHFLALLEKLYLFYDNKRSTSKDNMTKDGFIAVRDFNELTNEIMQESLLIPLFKEHIITSSQNYHHYPFIVKYKGKYIISPSRMWMGYRLLHYALHKDRINNDLARKYEKELLFEIERRLKKHNVVIVGKEVHTSKKGIELDLIGYYDEYVLIIEGKSFHPSPFFMMRKNRRYYGQFKRKIKNIEKIRKWMFTNLNKNQPKKGKIRIHVYDAKNRKLSEIIFPLKYYRIDQSKILYLYISQLKEYHEKIREDIIQVWYGDL